MMKSHFPVDVVIISRNRYPLLLNNILHLICNRVLPKSIVIVDSSLPKEKDFTTIEIIKSLAILKKIKIVYHYTSCLKSMSQIRNLGVSLTESKYVALLDDDATPPSDWIETIKSIFEEDPKRLVITGVVYPTQPSNYWHQVWWAIMKKDFIYEGSAALAKGNVTAFHRQVIKKLGKLFDEKMKFGGDDWTFSEKWRKTGGKIFQSPKLKIAHEYRTSLKNFFKQWFYYGRGGYEHFMLYKRKTSQNKNKFFAYIELFQDYFSWSKSMFEQFEAEKPSLYIGLVVALTAFFTGLWKSLIFYRYSKTL